MRVVATCMGFIAAPSALTYSIDHDFSVVSTVLVVMTVGSVVTWGHIVCSRFKNVLCSTSQTCGRTQCSVRPHFYIDRDKNISMSLLATKQLSKRFDGVHV